MPAAMRGARRGGAKARSKSSASPPSNRAGARKSEPQASAKPRADEKPRLPARLAFAAAVLVLAGGLIFALGAGGRGAAAIDAARASLTERSAALGLRLTRVRLQG